MNILLIMNQIIYSLKFFRYLFSEIIDVVQFLTVFHSWSNLIAQK